MPLDSIEVGVLPEKWVPRVLQPHPGSDLTGVRRATAPRVPADVRFLPARWLVALLALAQLLFKGAKISKLGVAGLVWSFAPRKLKIATAGLAVAASIVLLGAVAAITLLALQLA